VFKADEGCGKTLDKWIEALMKPVKPAPGAPATKLGALRAKVAAWKDKALGGGAKRPPFMLGQLPAECETVLKAAPATASAATVSR
jgi:murein endopeptidase